VPYADDVIFKIDAAKILAAVSAAAACIDFYVEDVGLLDTAGFVKVAFLVDLNKVAMIHNFTAQPFYDSFCFNTPEA